MDENKQTCGSPNFGEMSFSLGAAARCGAQVRNGYGIAVREPESDTLLYICPRHMNYFKEQLESGEYEEIHWSFVDFIEEEH